MVERVFHLIETAGPGGAEHMLINMVRGLSDEGIASTVLLLKEGWLRKELQNEGAKVTTVPLNRPFDTRWLEKVGSVIEEEKADVLHSHEFQMNIHAAYLAWKKGIPAIATVHGRNYYAARWYRRLAYRIAARQSQFVAVSQDIANYLNSQVGITKQRLTVLPNGVDAKRFSFNEKVREKTRGELHIDPETKIVLAVGNLYPVKGHSVLIRAAQKVLAKQPATQFFIAGRGQESDRLKELAKQLGLQNHIHFLGYRDDVHSLLCAADVFVLPSFSEGHPLSLLEAMACGRPVVASAVGGIPEVIRNGQNGLMFSPGIDDELSENIIRLLLSSAYRESISRSGYEAVIQRYSNGTMVKNYLQLYERGLVKASLRMSGTG